MLAGCLLACLPACTAICERRSGPSPIDHPIRSALCCLLSARQICQSALPPCLCTYWLLAPMWNETHTLPDVARECSSPSCTSSPTCTVLPYPSSDCVTLRPRCRHTPSRTSNALFRTSTPGDHYALCTLSATSKRPGYTLLPSLDRACAVVVILTPRGVSPPSVISDLIVLCT